MTELEMIVKSLTDEVENLKNERKKMSSEINISILALQTVSAIVGAIMLLKILI